MARDEAKVGGHAYNPLRGPGEWSIPGHALAASREPPPARHPVAAADVPADGLADLLSADGPVLVLDGDAAREAWDGLEADLRADSRSAVGTAAMMRLLGGEDGAGKLLLVDCTTGGLHPESLLLTCPRDRRLGLLAGPSCELSEAAAAGVRVVRVEPAPSPAP